MAEIIDKSTYKGIKPLGSRPGILYGLCKIHKETCNGRNTTFSPNSFSYCYTCLQISKVFTEVFKQLQQLINLLSLIHFTLLQKFVNRIPTYIWLVWTLIHYLLIPLEETINICVDNLYNDNENPPKIPKHNFCNLLNIATKKLSLCLTTNIINK